MYKSIFRYLFLVFCLHGCYGSKLISSKFKPSIIKTDPFYIQTFSKINAYNHHSNEYIFYIEGDGLITRNGINPTSDPTPQNKLVLRLVELDNRSNIFYIARPCQYTIGIDPICNFSYWTDKRWSKEVILSLNEAINIISKGNPIHLIGFSGGGGIAVLIAAINPNIKTITTIAGNLDIVYFNTIHQSKQSKGSLNPISFTRNLSIPQFHLVGENDKVVPYAITDRYIKASNAKYNKKIVCNYCDHAGDEWMIFWNEFLRKQSSKDIKNKDNN